MKKNLLNSLFVAVLMIIGTANSWAAGYTRTLTDELEVAGYQLKAFYDFQNNDPAVLPTSGDLRYRDGGIWGLHNFGSGTRSATATIPVANGDILLVQHYASDVVATINCGTLNANLSASTSYQVYDITADAESITFTIARYGGLVAAMVMEKDESAATASYTINYLLDGLTSIKTVSGEAVVGGSVATDASFFVENVKYFRVEGEPESFAITDGENNFNVDVRQANTYNYSLKSSLGGTLAEGTGLEGESVHVGYPRYQLADGKFYEAATTSKEYRKVIALNADNASATVDYAEKEGVNTVFYVEGEAIEGMTLSTANNIPVRASRGEAAVSAEDVTITTLPAGKYIFHAGIFTSKSTYAGMSVNFGIGEQTFAAAFTGVNLNEIASEEFTLNADTEIKFLGTSSWADAQFDYLWIEKTADVTPVPESPYSIAGAPADLFGASWDPTATATNMTLNTETGLYEWSKSDVTLAAGTVEFKVVVNHSWDEAYPSSNYALTIAEDGEYDVTITFNAETKDITASATKKGEAVIEKTYTVAGTENLFGSNWSSSDTNNDMVLNAETGLYEWSKSDVALSSNVEFKVVMNHDWANAWPTSNYVLTIAEEGTYDVTITFNAETKDITASATKDIEPLTPAFAAGTYYMMNASTALLAAANGLNKEGAALTFAFDDKTGYTITGSELFAGKQWIAEGDGYFTFSTVVDGVKKYAAVDEMNNFALIEDGTADGAIWILLGQAYWENEVLSYNVAGTEDLCGTEWDVNANKMTKNTETGLFEWKAENITVSADVKPEFKVAVNNTTDEETVAWYPSGANWIINTDVTGAEGIFTITITFNNVTKEIGFAAVKTGEIGEEPAPDFTNLIVNAAFNPEADPLGWEPVVSGEYRDYGFYQIGGEANVRFAAPTADATHLNTEYAAGFECRWSTNFSSYTQDVTLPAGAYALSFDVENVNGSTTKADYENRFFVKIGEETIYDESKEWMDGKSAWTTHTIKFVLAEEATVTISLGYGTGTNNIGANNTPAIYVSHIWLTDPLANAKAILKAEIKTAETLKATEGYNAGVEEFAAAIATAKNVLATATAEEELTAAAETLKAAEQAFIKTNLIAANAALVAGASLENPVVTPFVVNGTFDSNVNGWTCTGGFQNKATATNQQGDFTVPFFENWNPSAKVNKMYQVIELIPNGVYKLKIAAFVNTLADPNESQFVFANDDKEFLTTGAPTFYEVYTKVENNTLEIGLEQTEAVANWMGIDNVSLTYYGTECTTQEAYDYDHSASTQLQRAIAALQETINAANALKTEARKAGLDEFNNAIATAEAALTSTDIAVVTNADQALKDAMSAFVVANYYIDFAAGEYYIIEAETGLMMAAGHDWGTRGIVNETGLDLTLTPYELSRTVTINSRVSNGGNNHFLGSNLYMDSSEWGFALEYQGFGFYIIEPNSGKYVSIDANNNLVLSETPREWIIVSKDGVMAQRMEELEEASAQNPVDATFLLQNPNFNRNDQRVEAWTVSEDCTNKNLNGGNDLNNCAESFHSTFTIMQTVSGAPAGKYTLTAQGFYRQDDDVVEDAPVFFANTINGEVPVKTGSEGSMADASESFTAGLYTIDPIEFTVAAEGDDAGMIYVGITTAGTHQWVIFDNFRLTYYGPADTDAITELNAKAKNGQNTIYNLSGQKVEKAQKGLYIINGKKVVIK
jgi:hypothetical protein